MHGLPFVIGDRTTALRARAHTQTHSYTLDLKGRRGYGRGWSCNELFANIVRITFGDAISSALAFHATAQPISSGSSSSATHSTFDPGLCAIWFEFSSIKSPTTMPTTQTVFFCCCRVALNVVVHFEVDKRAEALEHSRIRKLNKRCRAFRLDEILINPRYSQSVSTIL